MSINMLGMPAASSLDYYPGKRLGNYYLVTLLAQGGSGSIYLARHQHLGTLAAMKVLHTQLDGDDLHHFREEACLLARLKHPHIVRVLDFDVERGVPFLVMEYAPHNTLRERYRAGVAYSPSTVLPHVLQVSSALHYLHEQGFIHRDIKPENMLLGKEYQVLLSDFGISTAALPGSVLTTVSRVGTVAYMAPEQIIGKACMASDQYALGATVYEWLSGAYLFHGTTREIASQHIHTQPEPLHMHVRSVSPAVEQVVLRALAKRPQDRFGSVEEFASAFTNAVENDHIYAVTGNTDTSTQLQVTEETDSILPVVSGPTNGPQTILKKGLRLLACDLFMGAGVLITLFGLHLPLFSLQLLLWLGILTAPMIYTWNKQARLGSAIVVTSFAVSALIGLLLQEFVVLVILYSFLLFVGLYITLCLKIRSERRGK